jgi:hypothetical protein
MSSADLVALRAVKETTFGVTPSSPALKQIRFTGESLNHNIENTTSNEIRPDRTQQDLVQTSVQGAGDINIELSYGSYKDFLAALFCSAWTAGIGDQEELTNGTTRSSFTIQKHFPDLSTPQFHNFKGCVIESLSLKMELGKIVEGSFNFLSVGCTPSTTQFSGATTPAAPSTTPMNAVANVQNLTLGGVPYTGCISSLSLMIKNNLRATMCIGSVGPKDIKLGTLEVTGDIEFYFNDGDQYAAYIAGTTFDIAFDLVDIDGNKYLVTLPRCKFEAGTVVAGGKNTDVMLSGKWRALYDATATNVIKLIADPV